MDKDFEDVKKWLMMLKEGAYFKQREGQNCFQLSLANLLLELGDLQTAQNVIESYPKSELVKRSGGAVGPAIPAIVEDLTDEKYAGRLFFQWLGDIKSHSKYVQAKYGRVAPVDVIHASVASTPSIIIVGKNQGITLYGDNLHAVVYLGDNRIVNNGVLQNYEPDYCVGVLDFLSVRSGRVKRAGYG